MILALGTGVAVPALPTLAKSFGVSFGLASGVVTMYLLGNLAGTIPSGWLVDRFGRRPVLIGGPLLSAAMAFLVAGAQSFPELLVLRFFNGVAAQMWIVARLAAISVNAEPGQRGRLVSWMFGMDSTGRLAGPVLGGFIAYEWGTRSPFIVYAALALLALVPTVLFAKDNTPRVARSEKKADAAGASKISLREIVLPRAQYFGVAFFAGLTRGPLQADLLYVYAAFAYALGPRPIGYLATSASVLSLPIGFIAGWVLDRFGRKRTMVPGFGGVSISMTALALSAFLHLSLAWYVPLFLCGVALQSFTGGSVQTVGADVAPPEARGTFLGIWRFASQGGAALSPIIFAVLSDTVSYASAFLFTAISASIVTFLLVRFVPETRKTA